MPEKKYTHVAVEPPTQRKVAILAKAMDVTIYSLVEYWANQEWQAAQKAGLVTEAMLKQPAGEKVS
jgi:hypothetical protein